MSAAGGRTPAVLLISPGIIKWTDMDFGLPHLVSIGGYLQQHTGVRVELLDLNYEGGDHTRLLETLERLGPYLMIGLSCYSSFDYMRVMTLARFLKQHYPDTPLITGGYHASALPGDVIYDGSPFDAVVVGEGERPMRKIVEQLLGGGPFEPGIHGPDQIEDLDELPPYQWELLNRYWPRAKAIGRKFQIYLARGCPYHCTFCMERAKSGYKWRAYSAERAVDELRRLSTFTDLGHWVINVADPLFGFNRRWRRTVLEGIIRHELFPRQYWTLTRSDDLADDDIQMLAKARFSIGIGLESGSPEMLVRMQKGNKPEHYLEAIQRLARLSLKHGLNWATNIIIGHPGETPETLRETRDFMRRLFTSAGETCGWLSIDPFRLYPGAQVHETMQTWSEQHGARFYHPRWWTRWYDGPFRAEHIDPSHSLDFEARVRFMYESYAPLVQEILQRFRGQGRSVDRVFARSLAEQAKQMSPATRDYVLRQGRRAKAELARARPNHGLVRHRPTVHVPIGLHVKDPWVREREESVRRLLEDGVLRTADLIEALLQVAPERYMHFEDARALLRGQLPRADTPEGALPPALGLRLLAMGLEALEPALGDVIADMTAMTGYTAAVLARLVGDEGRVIAVHPSAGGSGQVVAESLEELPQVELICQELGWGLDPPETVDGLWIGAALPRFPSNWVSRLRDPEGRAITFLGPRFRPQDLVSLTRRGDALEERIVARARVPVLAGPGGWISARRRAPVARVSEGESASAG